MELIRWTKSLDNGQVGGEKGGSTTFSMKTSKLFSPNARGEILAHSALQGSQILST